MTRLIKKFFWFLFLIFLVGCGAPVDTSDVTSDSGSVEDTTTSQAGGDPDESGTIVGNPTTTTKGLVYFALYQEDEEEESSEANNEETDSENKNILPNFRSSHPDAYCSLLAIFSIKTPFCRVTSDAYELGIIQLNLLSDLDSADIVRTSLYDGSPVSMNMTRDAEISFPSEKLNTLSEEVVAEGMEIIVAYIGHTFPSVETGASEEEASKVVSYLRGKKFRTCTLPETVPNAGELCGNSQAQFKDILVDLNNDDQWNFLLVIDNQTAEEVSVRPDEYIYKNKKIATFYELTDVEEGMLGHQVSFDEPQTITLGSTFTLIHWFENKGEIGFLDKDGDDTDPTYNPYDDDSIGSIRPISKITID